MQRTENRQNLRRLRETHQRWKRRPLQTAPPGGAGAAEQKLKRGSSDQMEKYRKKEYKEKRKITAVLYIYMCVCEIHN